MPLPVAIPSQRIAIPDHATAQIAAVGDEHQAPVRLPPAPPVEMQESFGPATRM